MGEIYLQILQLQLLQDEQQARHQRQKGLLEEELARLRQALHQSNRTIQQSKDSNQVVRLHCTFFTLAETRNAVHSAALLDPHLYAFCCFLGVSWLKFATAL